MSGYAQNWDSVTPPAIPSGWTVDGVFATAAAPLSGGLVPTSSPNVLGMTPANSNTIYLGTFGTLDGNSGNVWVQANFAVTAIGSHCRCGVTLRGSAYPLTNSSTTFYRGLMGFDTGLVSIQTVVNGAVTALGSPVSTAALGVGNWYRLGLAAIGTLLLVYVQRLSDRAWMNSAGNFVPSPTYAYSVTDSSIAGQGYSGVTVEQNASSGSPVYTDDWTLSLVAAVPPMPTPHIVGVPWQFFPPYQY